MPEALAQERRFAATNPGYIPGAQPCVYVGVTGLSLEERLQEPPCGHHVARIVMKYGKRLLAALYALFNQMPHDLAAAMEGELARQLRQQGRWNSRDTIRHWQRVVLRVARRVAWQRGSLRASCGGRGSGGCQAAQI